MKLHNEKATVVYDRKWIRKEFNSSYSYVTFFTKYDFFRIENAGNCGFRITYGPAKNKGSEIDDILDAELYQGNNIVCSVNSGEDGNRENKIENKSYVKEYNHFYTISAPLKATQKARDKAIKLGISTFWNGFSLIVKKHLTAASPITSVGSFVSDLPSVGNAIQTEIKVCVNGKIVDELKEGQTFLPIVYYSSGDYTNPKLPDNIYIQKKKKLLTWQTIDHIELFRNKSKPFHGFIIPKYFEKTYSPGVYRAKVDNSVSQKFKVVAIDTTLERKNTNFHNEVRKYVGSGNIFRSWWSNVEKVVWIKDIRPGNFFVVVDYNKGGGRRYYEVSSFEFPLSDEVISKIEEERNIYWDAETIRRQNFRSICLIVVYGLFEGRAGHRYFTRGGYFTEKDGWEFSRKRNSGYGSIAKDIAEKIYLKYPELQIKFLGEKEKEFLQDPGYLYSDERRIAMYKKIMIEFDEIRKIEASEKEVRNIRKNKKKEKYKVDWKNTKGHFKMHKKYGKIYVVTGEIINNNTSRMIPPLIYQLFLEKGTLEEKHGTLEEKLYMGKPIPEDDLLEMSKEEIKRELMRNEYHKDYRKRSPFIVVFFNPPSKKILFSGVRPKAP